MDTYQAAYQSAIAHGMTQRQAASMALYAKQLEEVSRQLASANPWYSQPYSACSA